MEIKKEWLEYAKVNEEKYSSMYDNSLQNNDEFWADQAQRVDWIKKFTKIKDIKYSKDDVSIKWFEDGNLNVSYNCIDRHAKNHPDKVANLGEKLKELASKESKLINEAYEYFKNKYNIR